MFIVLSGFATTDLSVSFCDACQGGRSLWKNGRCAAFSLAELSALCRYVRVATARRSRTAGA
ncbi:hypothetical protein QUH12_33325 [Klebsiella pneumoniae]|nr:hypothetical protein [Klebsiella pneumoniae]